MSVGASAGMPLDFKDSFAMAAALNMPMPDLLTAPQSAMLATHAFGMGGDFSAPASFFASGQPFASATAAPFNMGNPALNPMLRGAELQALRNPAVSDVVPGGDLQRELMQAQFLASMLPEEPVLRPQYVGKSRNVQPRAQQRTQARDSPRAQPGVQPKGQPKGQTKGRSRGGASRG